MQITYLTRTPQEMGGVDWMFIQPPSGDCGQGFFLHREGLTLGAKEWGALLNAVGLAQMALSAIGQ